jgi:mannose-P-dolichol utilization defect protein 1
LLALGLLLTAPHRDQILETAAYAISLAYASRNQFPFSTYGENFFLTVQNVIITLLIIWYSGARTATGRPLSAGSSVRARGNLNGVIIGSLVVVVAAISLSSDALVSPSSREFGRITVIFRESRSKTVSSSVSFLQATTVPLSLISKAPQIASNYQLKSTGNLSAFAVFNAFFGCLARLFTTSQETGDSLMWWGFALAGALNAVLVAQMVIYWNNPGSESLGKGTDRGIPMTSSPIRAGFGRKLD